MTHQSTSELELFIAKFIILSKSLQKNADSFLFRLKFVLDYNSRRNFVHEINLKGKTALIYPLVGYTNSSLISLPFFKAKLSPSFPQNLFCESCSRHSDTPIATY
mgnify:CR=1 FL=1